MSEDIKDIHTRQKLRILMIVPGKPGGGQFPFAHRQAASMAEKFGAEITIYHLQHRTTISGLLRSRKEVRTLIRNRKPQVVHVHYGTITAFLAVAVSSVPVMITFHGSDLNPTPTDGAVRDLAGRLLSQIAAFFAAGIICVSAPLKQRLWWRHSRVRVIPMGVDLQRFKPLDGNACRRELGWPADERIVLFNANNPALKRADIAGRTVSLLVDQGIQVRLEMLKGAVPSDRMPVLMNAADALLLCSDQEGSPTMVKEAMGCALPVVTSNVGDVEETTRGVRPGAVVDQDPHQLAAALLEVFQGKARSNGPEMAIRNGLDSEGSDQRTFDFLCEIARWDR